MTKAVIYVTTTNPNSVDKNACRQHCLNRDYDVVETVRDITPQTHHIEHVLKMAAKRDFDVLVVFSLDRIPRKIPRFRYFRRELFKAGIAVESANG